jgi:hypothetical protein
MAMDCIKIMEDGTHVFGIKADTVNVLGTEYRLEYQSEENEPKLKECLGFCEQYSKKIVVSDLEEVKKDALCVEDIDKFQKKILRHEIIHAFLGESGLRSQSEWAECEEMVDWFAIQHEKIHEAFRKAGALENE